MPDIWLDVDVALSEVPVNIFPLTDDTDFKSIEGAVAYNAGGMALRWHFVTSAGAYSVTSVTPTTGGDYDWTDQGDSGIYTIEIPASGGASINNDTEGYGWFTGVATGILPWRGPVIGFRAAAINDVMCDDSIPMTNFQRSAKTIVRGVVDTGASTTSIPTSSLSISAADADQFKGRIVIFESDTTTANLRGSATDITANTSGGTLTVTALGDTPVSGDTFVIV